MDGLNLNDETGSHLDNKEGSGWVSRPAATLPSLCACQLRARAQAIMATLELIEAAARPFPAARIAQADSA